VARQGWQKALENCTIVARDPKLVPVGNIASEDSFGILFYASGLSEY
jgi:hypothetical protein